MLSYFYAPSISVFCRSLLVVTLSLSPFVSPSLTRVSVSVFFLTPPFSLSHLLSLSSFLPSHLLPVCPLYLYLCWSVLPTPLNPRISSQGCGCQKGRGKGGEDLTLHPKHSTFQAWLSGKSFPFQLPQPGPGASSQTQGFPELQPFGQNLHKQVLPGQMSLSHCGPRAISSPRGSGLQLVALLPCP